MEEEDDYDYGNYYDPVVYDEEDDEDFYGDDEDYNEQEETDTLAYTRVYIITS